MTEKLTDIVDAKSLFHKVSYTITGEPISPEPFEPQNEILFVMDSVGWNEFVQSKTPNLDNLGPARPAYSHSYYTMPSMEAMFRGAVPQPFDGTFWPYGMYTEYGNMVIIPLALSEHFNYNTYLVSSNVFIGDDNSIEYDTFALNSYFDRYYTENFKVKSSREMIKWFLDNLVEPFFVVFLFIETHVPYMGYLIDGLASCRRLHQIEGIEYLDESFGVLRDGLVDKKLKHRTRIIATSDHSEAWWPDGKNDGHSPFMIYHYMANNLMKRLQEVFLVAGII